MNRKGWIAALSAAVIVMSAAAGFLILRDRPAESALWETAELKADQEGPAGVDADSTFTITCAHRMDEKAIRKALRFQPPVEYELTGSGKAYQLKPLEPLRENTVYTAQATDPQSGNVMRSFAFQTRTDLAVDYVYPGPGEEYVDPATGIEVALNAVGADVENAFSIEPAVDGSFKKSQYGISFLPSAPLDLNTVYRVTLDANLSVPDGRTLGDSFSFSFATRPSKQEHMAYEDLQLAGNEVELYLPGDEISLRMYAGEKMAGAEFSVVVQRYPNAQDYADAIRKKVRDLRTWTGKITPYKTDTSALETVFSIKTELQRDSSGIDQVKLPGDLQEGYYIVTLSGASPQGYPQLVQAFFQVANLSLYSQSTEGDTLLWINSPATGQPMEGVRCSVEDEQGAQKAGAVTDKTGVASITQAKTGESSADQGYRQIQETYLHLTRGSETLYFAPVETVERRANSLAEAYQSALYTDREIYQPDDVIRFWGVVRPRLDARRPDKVTVCLTTSWPREALYQTEAAVNQDGTFSGELPIEMLRQRGYSLTVTDGSGVEEEHVYRSKSLSVENYTKPPFVISVTHARNWYYADEPIDFLISASYYDGTPVAGGKMRLSCYEIDGLSEEGAIVTLDEFGKGTYTGSWKPQDTKQADWEPVSLWYQVGAADAQDVYISASGALRVVPSRRAVGMKYDSENRSLEVKTAAINPERLDPNIPRGSEGDSSAYEWYAAAPEELDVSVTLTKSEYIQVAESSYYDEVTKKTITKYRRERRESVAGTYQIRTAGGRAVIEDLPVEDPEKENEVYYEAVASFSGGTGRDVTGTFYGFHGNGRFDREETVYSFVPDENVRWARARKVPANGEITLGLYCNGENVRTAGRVFYSLLQSGVLSTGVYGENGQSLKFTAEYQPNLWVSGAYFDGRNVHEMETSEFRQDYTEKILDIQVRSDQEQYRPGQTAKITVSVRDAQGNPAAGSACIGVVDESVFALADQEVDLAGQLYAAIGGPRLSRRSTFNEKMSEATSSSAADGIATGGGADKGAAPRRQFADTAHFIPLEIDETGNASTEIVLPDNVTSWRITAAAVTSDLKAGDAKGHTITTLPFVLRPLSTSRYVEGDDVCVSILASAPTLGQSFDCNVRVTPAGGGAPMEESLTGLIGKRHPVNFGKLPAGEYELMVTGNCGGDSDTVLQTFTVTSGGTAVLQAQDLSLEELSTLEAARYPVNVTLYDRKSEPYMKALALLSRQDSGRTEIVAASYGASQIWNSFFEGDARFSEWDARLDQIQKNGGVKILPHSEPDPAATAKMIIAAPGLLELSEATDYLKAVLRDVSVTPDQRVMAYVGLAARGEPVLLDLRRLADESELSALSKLWIGNGAALLGDLETARRIYESASVGQGDEAMEGGAALLAVLIKSEDADARVMALCETVGRKQQDRVSPANLELLACAAHRPSDAQDGARVRYHSGDGDIEEKIGAHKVFRLTRDQLRQAKFEAIEGEARALVRYEGFRDSVQGSSEITIEKDYAPLSGDAFKTPNMALVTMRITFSKEAPRGMYALTDRIPSGMRFLSMARRDTEENDGNIRFNGLRTEGQSVRAYLHLYDREDPMPLPRAYDEESPRADIETGDSAPSVMNGEKNEAMGNTESSATFTIRYYVSCALPGEYKIQGAAIECLDVADVYQTSREGSMRIE